MLKEELIMKNPVRVLNPGPGEGVPDYRLGLVMARAGVGKTAILVQIAMDCLLRGYKVLHVSIGQSLGKTKVWYNDVFKSITEGHRQEETAEILDEVIRNRMIMTFKESSFSRPKLEERLNDLVYQNIFKPDCIVVDGYGFTGADREAVEDIKELMIAMDLHVWFSALIHREDTRISESGVPAPCHDIDDLFDTVIVLKPQEGGIRLNIIKDCAGCGEVGRVLNLDPSTMMVRET
jgi:KaiC/GvpD/RAD55 family RecA-like ATPase